VVPSDTEHKNTSRPADKGSPGLRGALGEAAVSAARTDTFLGARYRRIERRPAAMAKRVKACMPANRIGADSAEARPSAGCGAERFPVLESNGS
jgi:hypothetical protein